MAGDATVLDNPLASNSRSYMDVRFFPSRGTGVTLTENSIIEAGLEEAEFEFNGVGAGLPGNRVTVVGKPSALGGGLYRYYLQMTWALR